MCLYPRIIRNRKYTQNKKNKGVIPNINDNRTLFVPIGCGKCIECMRQKSREWKIRLFEEIRTNNTGKFVTLTFNNEKLNKIRSLVPEGTNETSIDNETATIAVRYFLERWRKKYKKSIKHWLITELGHKGTERLHLHGILFTETIIKDEKPYDTINDLEKIWQNGWVYIGKYVNEQTINYISKYVTKLDTKHPWFTGKILCSPGIGANYINREDAARNKYNKEKTKETYKTRSGNELGLPIYYKNKLYTESEREQLWINKLNKQERYVLGQRIDISNGMDNYYNALTFAREKNTRLGYGKITWDKKQYEEKRKQLVENKPQIEENIPQNEEINTQPQNGKNIQLLKNQNPPQWMNSGTPFE